MSQKADYAPHNPDSLEEGWAAVRLYAQDAILAVWDGCHKIYLAMDDEEARSFRNSPYAEFLVEEDDEEMTIVDAVEEWWESSCSLRMVSAVWTILPDRNEGYVQLISQFADEEEDDDIERCAVCGEPNEDCMTSLDGCVRCLSCGVLQPHSVSDLAACPLCATPWESDGH